MKRLTVLAVSAFAVATLMVACEQEPTPPTGFTPSFSEDVVEGSYIVVLQDGVDPADLAASYGVATQYEYRYALSGFSAELPDNVRQAIEQNPLVRWVEPVKMRQLYVKGKPPDKPCNPKSKKCEPPPPPTPGPCVPGASDPSGNDIDPGELYGIEDVGAPESPTWIASPVDIDIAILDTGVDTDHEDLCVHNAVDFVGEGFEDFNGHGSHTSGTAGARDDNDPPGQVVGVAPTARIWAVKVCNLFGLCPSSAIVAGIDYVTANAGEIDVANMSLGGGGSDQEHPIDPIDCSPISGDAEHLAICNSVAAGVTYVVAAGNGNSNAANFTPAAFDEVITVSASDINENEASFSNWGHDVDLIAPGVNIKSTLPNNSYGNASGTSMSSPHVAGGAAVFIAHYYALNGVRPLPIVVRNTLVADGRSWAGQDPKEDPQPDDTHPEPMLDISKY